MCPEQDKNQAGSERSAKTKIILDVDLTPKFARTRFRDIVRSVSLLASHNNSCEFTVQHNYLDSSYIIC